jgi:mannose-6-phosphate isomerase-like protein (cupin superfamily)
MTETLVFPNWKEKVVYPSEGVHPQVLADTEKYKVLIVGLEAGQKIPVHPESTGVYFFLEGSGLMKVNGEEFSVGPGETLITPDGATRGIEAKTRLAFLAVKIN